jgi:tetratricopeptide (TPR) repeat protein
MQETDLEIKYGKLKQQFPAGNPAVTTVMEDLAHVAYRLQKYGKAECVYQQLLDLYRQTLGPNNLKTLRGYEDVILSLKGQGCYSKAKLLNEDLRCAISKLVEPHHPIALRAAERNAWLTEVLEEKGDAETVRRNLLQIRLASYGPRHPGTVRALSILGYTISQRGGGGGEVLLRTAVQLSVEDPDGKAESNCWGMAMLAQTLDTNGRHEEGYNVATKAIEQFGQLLGPKHKQILSLEEKRAWSLLKIGRFAESEKLFRDLVSCYSNSQGEENKKDLANVWRGLANVLSKKGNAEEAIGWYDKSYRTRLSIFGANHSMSIATCCELADCYEVQNSFNDTLTVYRQAIDRIRASGKDPNKAIACFESEISRIGEQIEQRAINCPDGDEENTAHSSNSNGEARNRADEGAYKKVNDGGDPQVDERANEDMGF